MIWIGLYATTAIVVTTALFLLTEFLRAPGHAGPRHPGQYAVVAGLLWPVLVVAAAQYGVIAALGHGLSRMAAPSQAVPARIAQRVG
jgi:hypothetical protein